MIKSFKKKKSLMGKYYVFVREREDMIRYDPKESIPHKIALGNCMNYLKRWTDKLMVKKETRL